MKSNISHVPACQCSECKPLGDSPAMPATGEAFRVFFELSIEFDARDYYTAKVQGELLASSIKAEISKQVVCDVRCLHVERK